MVLPSMATEKPKLSYVARRRPSAWPPRRTWRRRRRAEDVGRARAAVTPLVCTDHDGIAVYRHGEAEEVLRRGVGGRQLGHLDVRGTAVGSRKT